MGTAGQGQVTRILAEIGGGDPAAARELLPLVYEELRKLADDRMRSEPAGQTLQPTALVHEAYLRLVGDGPDETSWNSRGHFFGAAAEVDAAEAREVGRTAVRVATAGDVATTIRIRREKVIGWSLLMVAAYNRRPVRFIPRPARPR